MFPANLQTYIELALLPFQDINVNDLDDGDGMAGTLLRHDSKWHSSCKAMIKKSKIERLRQATKKHHASAPIDCTPDPKYTRSKGEAFSMDRCFLTAMLRQVLQIRSGR